eukprot:14196335-Alexandrium_andersonii.AAC.1
MPFGSPDVQHPLQLRRHILVRGAPVFFGSAGRGSEPGSAAAGAAGAAGSALGRADGSGPT